MDAHLTGRLLQLERALNIKVFLGINLAIAGAEKKPYSVSQWRKGTINCYKS